MSAESDREMQELLHIRAELAGLNVLLKLERLRLALKRFNPGQPRVPAGNPDGGQWTQDESGNPSQEGGADASVHPATLDGAPNRWTISPYAEEARGGHTLERHVGKSDRELVQRIERERFRSGNGIVFRFRAGTFRTVEEAREYIEKTLDQNQAVVERVATGEQEDAFIMHRFGYVVGREAIVDHVFETPRFRSTYAVGVYLKHDSSSPNGFTIRSAFPLNQDR